MSSEQKPQDLVVIGAGYGRTGTLTLKTALSYLLSGNCYHMHIVAEQPAKLAPFWLDAFNRQGRLSEEEWREHLKDFVAAVDVPTSAFYRELMEVYPNAKVILTIRDPDSWVRSSRATILSKDLHSSLFTFLAKNGPMKHFFEMRDKLFEYTMGPDWRNFTDEQWKEFFIRWNQEVEQHVPKDRLLVFKVQEGWKPLCEFLNLPEPPADVPFPRVNDTAEFQGRINTIRTRLCFLYGGLLIAAGATLIGVSMWLWNRS